MTPPAIGEPEPGRAAPSRSGIMDAGGGILVILALGLTFRLIIAYLLPGSGFRVDLQSFRFWADNLADAGLFGFYERRFFHDYTPGYLYVLWLVGGVGNVLGSVGDLIKIPPILADVALAYLVWSMVRELGGSERSARIGAVIVLANPVTWMDSVVWGQVDSFGVVFLLLALRELWRDRPERAAILATVAALIKPQLGILIPIVAIVVIRRALWPKGGYGLEEEPEPGRTTTSWERRFQGPVRIVTTGLAGLLTAIVASMPFGLSFPGLIAQIFKTAAGYPYLSVNAFNPWALWIHKTPEGNEQGIALNRAWVCDSTIVPTGPSEFRIGPFVIPELSSQGSTLSCPDGVMIGAFPAVVVGAVAFLIVAALVLWMVGRRPDRITMLIGLAVLSLAFFVLPTRVHERYLFPLAAIGAVLAAVSLRWRIAYVLSAAATFANMYVILTTYYRGCLSPGADPESCNPSITDWLGVGDTLASDAWVTGAALIQVAVLVWAFFQLREVAVERVADDVALAGRGLGWSEDDPALLEQPVGEHHPSAPELPVRPEPSRPLPRWADALTRPSALAAPRVAFAGATPAATAGALTSGPTTEPVVVPTWQLTRDSASLGPVGWLRARLADTPVRANRSRTLERERGGRVDRLDAWILVVLAISMLTVRMWRLDEPYQTHFDEVYHPRTATEFLQSWRYDMDPPEIYEWTHPHLAKYAMALGLVLFGEDTVGATSRIDAAVLDAAVEPRRDDGLDASRIEGDRLWVATGSEVRAYDLATRQLAGTVALSDATAVAYDTQDHKLYIGTRGGEIRVVDVEDLDANRRGPPAQVDARGFMDVDAPVDGLMVNRDGDRLVATLGPTAGAPEPAPNELPLSTIAVIDVEAALELARNELSGVNQVGAANDGRILVATESGLAVIDSTSGLLSEIVDVGGPAKGVVGIRDIDDDPIYVPILAADGSGPKVAILKAETAESPRIDRTIALPGERAGRAYFDVAARMVHVEGSVQGEGADGQTTIYVIEPHGNAIYADARLPYVPRVMVLDDNQAYPSSDRQQLLAFDEGGGVASVAVGRHAYAWRVPGVIAGVLMAMFLYVLARILFQRRSVAVILGIVAMVEGMLFVQSRIGMNDSYVGLGIVGAYTLFAALWLHPGDSRRHWVAFALGMPLIGLLLGFALASKWVAAFAIGGLGILVLVRSALGRLILTAALVLLTTVLGYIAISVGEGETGGNYLFLAIMIALVVVAVIANILHPIAWTMEEVRFAVGAPAVVGAVTLLYGLSRGDAAQAISVGPISLTPIEIGLLALIVAAAMYAGFLAIGRLGFGPFAWAPEPDDPTAVLEPPAPPPKGWLRLGTGFGLPAIWLVLCLIVLPLALYVISYIPWAFVGNHRIVEGWPPGNTGQTLLQLTESMYGYHNGLASAHPASSPWWAWMFDLKPVWFYAESFAGSTSAAIYDSGNIVAWWLAVPAIAFVAWQAFRRRSAALALIAIGFAVQWLSWARIDRAAFQYHYYTALPFLLLALAYFLAELWHGTSRRIWLVARLAAAAAITGPFVLWLLHRPLCALAGVSSVKPDSRACPAFVPDVEITVRTVVIAVTVGLGVLLLLRELLAVTDEDEPPELRSAAGAGGWRGMLARIGLGGRWTTSVVIAVGTSIAFFAASALLGDDQGLPLQNIPVEPIAVVVLLALTPVAAYVATARDSRRFVVGALGAMAFWFVLWYPNLSGLPLPAAIHNAYQGFLPTYIYDFQFAVNNKSTASPSLFDVGPAVMLGMLTLMAVVVAYSAWSWRIALAERRRDRLAAQSDPPPVAMGAE